MMNPMSSESVMTDGRAEAYPNQIKIFFMIFQLINLIKHPHIML
jgi:hypothetical protein